MEKERRNDIGNKLTYTILTALITLVLSIFFLKTYDVAEEAQNRSHINATAAKVLQQGYSEINRRLASIETKLNQLIQ